MNKITLLFGLFIVLNSCIKNNPDPSWLEITAWDLIVNTAPNTNNAGVLTHDFSDAWVYVDNELVGVFELPVKIPLLISGDKVVKIFPAIKNNGISATKKIYPFVEIFEVTLNFIQNETITINPVTKYVSTVKFNIEDFEDTSTIITEGPTSSSSLTVANTPSIFDPAINETGFGRVLLDELNNQWIASTLFNENGAALNMNLPQGREVYLEIDYYNTNSVVSGLIGVGNSGITTNPNVQLNFQDASNVKWKKIYIDLKEAVSGMANIDYYEFSFEALIKAGETNTEINIDNIKAVYF
ncbi:MAG: hypothetical protein ACKVJC_11070 [Flavobacteriales bacterium]|nr:hypothetical protein [Crocinitomicaceae bacterium]MDB4324003.1 hypothetical protein [Crocinitomicaceae bacterium]